MRRDMESPVTATRHTWTGWARRADSIAMVLDLANNGDANENTGRSKTTRSYALVNCLCAAVEPRPGGEGRSGRGVPV